MLPFMYISVQSKIPPYKFEHELSDLFSSIPISCFAKP